MEIFIINTCVITMLMIIILLTLLFGTTTAVAVAATKRSNSDMKDKPDGKIIATPWGSYRRSSSAAEEMKTRFRNFKATKVVKTPVFKQTNIVNKYSHDSAAETKGLALEDVYPYVIEVTGGENHEISSIRRVNYLNGKIKSSREFPNKGLYSYSGLGIVGTSIYIGTRNTNTIFVYDRKTFAPKKIVSRPDNTFILPAKGAAEVKGLTSNNFDKIYISDGTSNIYVYDNFLAYKQTIEVKDGNTYIRDLTALSYVNGLLYANIARQNSIAKILPETGDVVAWLVFDGQSLYPDNPNPWRNFINGIAYNSFNSTFIFTGLNWPYIFEMKENDVDPMKNVTQKWVEENCWSPRKAYRSALAKYEKIRNTKVINIPHDRLTNYREDKEHANTVLGIHAAHLLGGNDKDNGMPSFTDGIKEWNVEDHRFWDFKGERLRPGIMKYTPGGYYNKYPDRRPTYEDIPRYRHLRRERL